MHNAPFDEHETIVRARTLATRLAASPLAIYVTGEAGTGRRTLAMALAEARARGNSVTEVRGGLPLPLASGAVVLVHDVELLAPQQQVHLAGWIVAGSSVVAWGPTDWPATAHAELRAHIANAVVELAPLRDRGSDAIAWARHFATLRGGADVRFAAGVEEAIARHSWPGNLAQLDGAIARGLALRVSTTAPLIASDLGIEAVEDTIEPLGDAVDRFKREYVQRVLSRFGGNRTRTARALGVDARTIFRFLERDGDG
jgi:DNA-binding NtrC family response regulator